MAGKTTVACTNEQYETIISTIYEGCGSIQPNPRVATALVVEANTGLRIGDVREYPKVCVNLQADVR